MGRTFVRRSRRISSSANKLCGVEPSDITTSKLTHILYAFADIAANGSAILTDIFADEQVRFI